MVRTNRKIKIEEYYDAERNEIIDFPPPSEDFLRKARSVARRMKEGNKRVDELVKLIDARNEEVIVGKTTLNSSCLRLSLANCTMMC